jgi:hypothetical protein
MLGPEVKSDRRRGVLRGRVLAVATGAVLIVGLGATGGVAASLVTSADIKNDSVRAVDLAAGAVGSGEMADGSVTARDLARDSVAASELRRNSVGGSQIRPDAVTTDELSAGVLQRINNAGDTVGPNWGVVDRNVVGGGAAYLRTGPSSMSLAGAPVTPPLGIGSLGLRTGSGGDRAAFGNQVMFTGDLVSGLTTLGFSVFTTDENNRRGNNMPSIVIEIDPNLSTGGVDFASMVYTPPNGRADEWTFFDATDNTQGRVWALTGAAGSAIACAPGGGCTWDQIQNRLEDGDGLQARIRSVQITKGADFAFSGAVDNLRIRDQVYDFEPHGVHIR